MSVLVLWFAVPTMQARLEGERGDKGTRRQGDKETRGEGDKETRRQGDKETRGQGDKGTRRMKKVLNSKILQLITHNS
jgi:hypothetical protein